MAAVVECDRARQSSCIRSHHCDRGVAWGTGIDTRLLLQRGLIGTAILSFGIWSGAEAFHLPFHSGMTDIGASAGYVFASLALFFAAAGSAWSVDAWLRPRNVHASA